MKRLALILGSLLCTGCLLDSVEPWLSSASIVEAGVEVDGDWSVVEEVEMFGSESGVSIERKPATDSRPEFFYITVRPLKRDTQFVFRATVHEIAGRRFLQVSNFTHFDDHIFGLANRPTYSLWQIEADGDNIAMWMPALPQDFGERLSSRQDQDDKILFVDSAANNEAAIREWAEASRKNEDSPGKALMLALTRKGTEFTLPAGVERHLPEVYRRATGAKR